MPEYTLNPSVITSQLPQMPQINANNGVGINTTPLPNTGGFNTLGQIGSSALGSLGSLANPLASGLFGLAGNLINMFAEDKRAKIQREWNEKMIDKQNAFSVDMWNKTNEYNTPANQVQRLKDAGLNPLYYGLDGSSANAFQSAQALGYERGSNPNGIQNPIPGMIDAELKQAQVEGIKAQTEKVKAETDETALNADFLRATFDSRVEAEKLQPKLTKARIEEIEETKKKLGKEINLLEQQAKTEFERTTLVRWQAAVQKATAEQIEQLTPVMVALYSAQTEAQKSIAALNFTQAAYQQGLIDSGYIDDLCNELKSRAAANSATSRFYDSNAVANELRTAMKSGKYGKLAEFVNTHPWTKDVFPAMSFLATDIWPVLNMIGESGLFNLGGLLFAGTGTKLIGNDNRPIRPIMPSR